MSKMTSEPNTYGRLSDTLTTLGFLRNDTEDYISFRNASQNALIALPVMNQEETLRQEHLIAAQSAVVATGMLSKEEFQRMLTRRKFSADPHPPQPRKARSEAA